MATNIALTKKMLAYARQHKLEVPKVSTTVQTWGKGKKTLAWRVSGHIHEKDKSFRQTANHTEQLDRYFFPMTKGQRALKIAVAEIGVTESPAGSNDGPRVREYQSSTGAYRAPWCASFVTWCLKKAGFTLPSFNRAYVPSWHQSARTGLGNMSAISTRNLQPGDPVCLWHDGHIELFEKWIVKYVVMSCIGGNTSVAGKNNNGGGVFRTRRYAYDVSCAVRVK